MSGREREDVLLAGPTAEDELEELRRRAATDHELAADLRIVDALADADGAVWRDAETPALRFAPEGAGRALPVWSRLCIRSDARRHSVGAPLVTALAAIVLLAGLGAGYLLRGGLDDAAPVADRQLEAAPAVSLVRTPAAPAEAGGMARMVAGRDGRMMLRVHGLRPTDRGRWYAVWMRGRDGRAVHVGGFRVAADGSGGTRMPLRVDPQRYPAVEVTLQSPADTRAPSGRDVLRSSPAA